jgi:multidrug efflux system outer membrane protein
LSRLAFAVPLALALAGCSLAPDYARPAAPVPQSWPAGDAYLQHSEAALPEVSYRDVFRDPRLQALVEQALANNRDVRIAAANLAAARARVGVVRSAQFPEVGVSASAAYQGRDGRRQPELCAPGRASPASSSTCSGASPTPPSRARTHALATEAAARTVRLGLVADLANAWATYAAERDLLAIAAETAANARRAVELTQARLDRRHRPADRTCARPSRCWRPPRATSPR